MCLFFCVIFVLWGVSVCFFLCFFLSFGFNSGRKSKIVLLVMGVVVGCGGYEQLWNRELEEVVGFRLIPLISIASKNWNECTDS